MKKHAILIGTLVLCSLLPLGNTVYAAPFPQEQAAQSMITVKGKVIYDNGEPIIGASVVEKGTFRGTATDADGNFDLKVKEGSTLKFSYIGCKPKELKATPKMTVTLASDNELLDEVVVVGYGTQKKVNVTGAVSTVDISKQLEARPQEDLAKALQGAVPGLTITNSSGNIGDNATIRIRGLGTLSNGEVSNPLFVVDGVPMDDISYLNTQDIESISVLKDAASTSIYGTRAAFGVILINTKGAKPTDRISVSYTGNFAWSQPTYVPDYPDVPTQLIAAMDAKTRQGGGSVELFGMYFDQLLPYAKAWKEQHNGKADYRPMQLYQSMDNVGDYFINSEGQGYYYADWDVKKIFYNNAAPAQSHAVNVQGTSGKTNFFASFGYNSLQGIMNFNPDKLHKYNASVNVSTNVTDWLQVGARFNFSRKEYTRPDTWQSTYQYLWRWGSFFGPYGTVDGQDFRVIAMRNQAATRKNVSDLTRMNAYLKAEIIKGLTLNADFTYSINNMNSGSADFAIFGMNNWSTITEPSYIVTKGNTGVWRDNAKDNMWTTNVFANYARTFNQSHNLNVMLGGNGEYERYDYFYASRNQLIDQALPELNLASSEGMTNSASAWQRSSAGYFGRINYDYKGIYLLELNGRYDGSSRFPKNDHWAFFPSASVGYRFSLEPYWDKLRSIMNNGKLRLSYGEIGNEAIGNDMFLSTISQISSGSSYWLDGSGNKLSQYAMPSLVSSQLSWERIRTIDVGLDLGFLNDQFVVGFDWFQRETRDMLAPAQVLPSTVGASAPLANSGRLRTSGWELNINWRKKFGEFDVYANFNLGDAKTKITEWNSSAKLLNSYYSGKTYGDIWGFETDRYFTVDDFSGKDANGNWIYNQGVASQVGLQNNTFVYGPGDIKFKDLNNDGKIDGGKGTEDDHGDLKVIGNSMPRYEYSFHIGGNWRGFDIDLFFQGVGRRYNWTQSAFVFPMMRAADLSIYANQTGYNTVTYNAQGDVTAYNVNQSNEFPRLYPGNEGSGTVANIASGCHNYYPQSRYLVDMSYLRLKNVTIGYTIPERLSRKAFIQRARVYFSADNLALLYKGSGNLPIDPEVNTGEGSLGYGTWGRVAPINRTLSCGLQVTF